MPPVDLPSTVPAWAWPAAALALAVIAVAVAYAVGRRARIPEPSTAGHSTGDAGPGQPSPAEAPVGDAGDPEEQPDEEDTDRLGRRFEAVLTFAAAAVATAGAWTGMLHVAQRNLHMDDAEAYTLGGFLELAMVASGIRARRHVRQHGTSGPDGAIVWLLAFLSAGMSAAAEDNTLGRAARFALPVVAAIMWERFLATDRRDARAAGARGTSRIVLRWTPTRLAMWLGIAEPQHRAVDEVARARRLARLIRVRIRTHTLETHQVPTWVAVLTARSVRRSVALWLERRRILRAVEHDGLGVDPAIAARIMTTTAAVVTFHEHTKPEALDGASPWSTGVDRIGSDRGIESGRVIPGSVLPPAGTAGSIGSGVWIDGSDRGPLDRIGAGSGAEIGSDRARDRVEIEAEIGSGRVGGSSGSDRVVPFRGSTRGPAPIEARPGDVEAARQLIASGDLDPQPSGEAIRRALRISPDYARACRDALRADGSQESSAAQ